jgi:hypothetical protein
VVQGSRELHPQWPGHGPLYPLDSKVKT